MFDFVIVAAVLSFILASDSISASSAGFILSFVVGLSSQISYFMMSLRDLEVGGVSLERLAEYRELPQEVYEPGDEGAGRLLSSRPPSPQ